MILGLVLTIPQRCRGCREHVPWAIAVPLETPDGKYAGVRHPTCEVPNE